ncbi:MAG: GNAT family N-acetyltransferase [Alphaproteobacteria bacterium]|nr:GNAT family N-acetyltransferase [Alphaproteobacteria bacterium]
MLEAQTPDTGASHHLQTNMSIRVLTPTDIPAILTLQDAVIANLQPTEKHFLKKRDAVYLEKLLTLGIGVGLFDTTSGVLVAQALLRRQTFESCETNCNVNNFLRHAAQTAPALSKHLLPELHDIGWGVIGTMLVSPDAVYHRKGLARQVINALMAEYLRQGGKHVFASTAVDNLPSQKVFDAFGFSRLAEAVDPKDGWRCVIFHHPPLAHLHQGTPGSAHHPHRA